MPHREQIENGVPSALQLLIDDNRAGGRQDARCGHTRRGARSRPLVGRAGVTDFGSARALTPYQRSSLFLRRSWHKVEEPRG